MMTAMRQLGRPLGKSSKIWMKGIRTYRIMGINRRRAPPHEGPPAAPGHADRTAGGLGGAAPASLDLYGQSRMHQHIAGLCFHYASATMWDLYTD